MATSDVRAKMAALMADGRWRTTADMAVKIGEKKSVCGYHAARMVSMGLLVSEQVTGALKCTVYRSSLAQEREGIAAE